MTKQCVFYWGNQPAEGGGNFALQGGINPSTGSLRFQLRQAPYINQLNTLTITDHESVMRVFRNCRVTRAAVLQSGGGPRWYDMTFEDRRWMWSDSFFAAYGAYNRPAHHHGLQNQKSVRELAQELMEALGEPIYDVSALPTTVGPMVEWDAANPAAELQLLVEQYGCMVTLSNADVPVIHRIGYGQTPMPDFRQMDFTEATQPPIIPAALVFEGGRTHIQHDVPLVAMCEETSSSSAAYGRMVPIDQVSYKPAGGWHLEVPGVFAGVAAASRPKAIRDVWRVYGIGTPFQLPMLPSFSIGTNGKRLTATQQTILASYFNVGAGAGWRCLPISEEQNPTSYGNKSAVAPEVIGWRYQHAAGNWNTSQLTALSSLPAAADDWSRLITRFPTPTTSQLTIRPTDYKIDTERGLVTFTTDTYFKEILLSHYYSARLRLRCAVPLRDPDSAAFMCAQVWNAPGSPIRSNVVKLIKKSNVWLEYGLQDFGSSTLVSNESFVRASAADYLAQELNTYAIGRGYSAPYKGFVTDVDIDGIVRSVVWDVSEDGAGTTHIDYNMERPEMYLTLAEARSRRMTTYFSALASENNRKILRRIMKP